MNHSTKKSHLGLIYFYELTMIGIGYVYSSLWYAVSEWLMQIYVIAMLLPIGSFFLCVRIIIWQGLLYLFGQMIGYPYIETKTALYIEKHLWSFFPSKYRSTSYHIWGLWGIFLRLFALFMPLRKETILWKHTMNTVYHWVLMIQLLALITLIGSIGYYVR
jgi:hypothetical protein